MAKPRRTSSKKSNNSSGITKKGSKSLGRRKAKASQEGVAGTRRKKGASQKGITKKPSPQKSPKRSTQERRHNDSESRPEKKVPRKRASIRKIVPSDLTREKPEAKQRLQKILAGAGVASRRECEQYIIEGRVMVDDEIIKELGAKADPTTQKIYVDGVLLPSKKTVYYLLNKPSGVLSTNRDPAGRQRTIDLVPGDERLFTVGRLDKDSQGLVLLTNDGTLAQKLTHPKYGIEKIYQIEVEGIPTVATLNKLREGIHLAEGFVQASHIQWKKKRGNDSVLEITLREGRNREIRRMFAAVGHKIRKLKRIAIGPVSLGKMPLGAFRPLTPRELKQLQKH
ncbi:MAG: rRNA pseudouridine synthase [Pirellulaceae bacterium]|nr:rRNA pseudouridine synthase [Pirellulaceae bacterium]